MKRELGVPQSCYTDIASVAGLSTRWRSEQEDLRCCSCNYAGKALVMKLCVSHAICDELPTKADKSVSCIFILTSLFLIFSYAGLPSL